MGGYRARLKSAAIRQPWLWRLQHAARLRWHRWRNGPSPRDPLREVLNAFARQMRAVFFIQIGSNDATHGDPLREFVLGHGWRGIMVEPVPYVFERLRTNYQDRPDLILENLAISDHDGTMEFYSVAQSNDSLPEWYDQLGSFSLETILKHAPSIPRLRERIVTLKVPSLSFDSLCRKHGVGQVDLIHIDTEGYDFEIIKLIDLGVRAPAILLYEHRHLNPQDRATCRAHLVRHGYEILEAGGDTLCLHYTALRRESASLSHAWRDAQRAGRPD